MPATWRSRLGGLKRQETLDTAALPG